RIDEEQADHRRPINRSTNAIDVRERYEQRRRQGQPPRAIERSGCGSDCEPGSSQAEQPIGKRARLNGPKPGGDYEDREAYAELEPEFERQATGGRKCDLAAYAVVARDCDSSCTRLSCPRGQLVLSLEKLFLRRVVADNIGFGYQVARFGSEFDFVAAAQGNDLPQELTARIVQDDLVFTGQQLSESRLASRN